jgi:hypothetical protein
VARLIADRLERCALLQGDAFFGFVRRGYIDPWLPEANEQNVVVTQASAMAAGAFAKGGFTTIFDGMVGPWFVPTFLDYCGLDAVHYAILLPDIEMCVARVLGRTDHGFRDEAATRQMFQAFDQATVDARHVLDATGEASLVAQALLERFEDEELVYRRASA